MLLINYVILSSTLSVVPSNIYDFKGEIWFQAMRSKRKTHFANCENKASYSKEEKLT